MTSFRLLLVTGLSELKEGAGPRLGRHCLFCFDSFPVNAYKGVRVCCTKPSCRAQYKLAAKRDAANDVWQIPTPIEQRKAAMAMTEEEEAKLKAEHAATQKQLADLLQQQKTVEGDKSKEKARNEDSPGKLKLDPDIAKEMQELKIKVAGLESKLGASKDGGAFAPLDLFSFGNKK